MTTATPTARVSRDARLDLLRGLTILLVVLGHVIMYSVSRPASVVTPAWVFVENVIWAFHMPLFAYLSGWAMSLGRAPDSARFLVARLRSVMLPYAAWTMVALVFALSGFWRAMSPVPGTMIGAFSTVDLTALPGLLDFYWFLPAIFGCYALWWLAHRSAHRDAWMIAIAIAAVVIHTYLSGSGSLTLLLEITWLFPFFAIGAITKAHFDRIHPAVWVSIAAVFAGGVWLQWPIVSGVPSRLPGRISSWLVASGLHGTVILPRVLPGLITYATAACGVALFVSMFGVLARTGLAAPSAAVGKRSLGIYVTHPLFAALLIGAGVTSVAVVAVVASTLSLAAVFALGATRPTALVFLGAPSRARG